MRIFSIGFSCGAGENVLDLRPQYVIYMTTHVVLFWDTLHPGARPAYKSWSSWAYSLRSTPTQLSLYCFFNYLVPFGAVLHRVALRQCTMLWIVHSLYMASLYLLFPRVMQLKQAQEKRTQRCLSYFFINATLLMSCLKWLNRSSSLLKWKLYAFGSTTQKE